MALSFRFSRLAGLKRLIDRRKTIRIAATICFWILMTSTAPAALRIDSVYPNLGKVGEDLEVTISGKGFDENTRVSMSLDVGNAASIIGSVDTPGSCWNLKVSGNTAYVADGLSGLQVIDISNPAHPAIMGSVDTPGSAWDVNVSGSMAYVADRGPGLQAIDISNPTRPTLIGSVDTPGEARDVKVSGSTAYVADNLSGLQVIDISSPSLPAIIGSVDTPGRAVGVFVSGNMAYVADVGGLQMIDISNPSRPTLIGSVATPGVVCEAYVAGSRAYVTVEESGLQVIDISNPAFPTIIGSVDMPGGAWGVKVSGSTAYVAASWSGFQVIDISNSSRPTIVGTVDTPDWANGVYVSGGTAYVADRASGLQVIDISNPSRPTIIGAVGTPGGAWSVFVSGNTAYVADYTSGLQVIDISNPSRPTIIGSVDTPGVARGVYVSGSTAYVADRGSGLQVIDISNPAFPTIIGSVDTPGEAIDVYVSGNTAYVADYTSGLQVIDISNPARPTIIGSVDTPGWACEVKVSGDTASVADITSGLQLIDISNPTRPTIISSVDTPGYADGVCVSGSTAYVADRSVGLSIVPVPVEIDAITLNSDTRITCTLPSPQLSGNYNLRVFNASGSDEIKGAVTFLEGIDFNSLSKMKAIIVAGGGDYAGNTLWPGTRLVANQAYSTLISQGYTKENIYYLGPHSVDFYPEDDVFNDVDAEATSAYLSWAIKTWAQDASELFVFMTDHGKDGTFQLNENESYFPAQTLDAWLDSLQTTMPGRVVVVYDACNSGSFIPLLTPPSGKERVVITSAQAGERAWFMNGGVNSFSYQFWASAWLKGNLYDAFLDAGNMMGMDQTALLDADGDGSATTKNDQTVAGTILIGRGRSAASLPPSIIEVSTDQTLNGETSTSFWACLGEEELTYIDSVWAVVVSPDQGSVSSDIPVTNLPRIDFTDSNEDGTFEGKYAGFTQQGTYRVIVYANDKEGLYSLPRTFNVIQQKGATSDGGKDGGYFVTSQLWAKAVLQVPGNPVTLIWKEVGSDTTPSGDKVVSGYFYADPGDFAYGSEFNPEVFVKIYIAKSGWCNIAFNHVTVDNVSISSAHHYAGSANQSGTASLANRLVETPYDGVSVQ